MPAIRIAAAALLFAAPLAAQSARGRPEGWRWRFDRPNAVDSTLSFQTVAPGWHITTGPSGILYNPAQTASGAYRVETRIFLFQPSDHAEGFGLFVGGQNLTGAEQSYTYFLVRKDGRFMIRQRTGATTRDVVPWTPNAAITAHPGDTSNVRNDLAVQVAADSVRFAVNGTTVSTLPRGAVPTDGQVGLRVNHGLNLHVSKLEIARQ
jgi:hypothetical protein